MKKYLLKEYINILKEHELIKEININDEELNKEINSVTYNSKEVKEGTMFICKGINFKLEYLEEAINKKASLYISEEKYLDYPCIIVSDIRKVLALISFKFYDYPFKNLNLIGITGTKGKTTTTFYIKSILNECGVLSSIYNDVGDGQEESKNTTPESLDLARFLREAKDNNLKNMVMEVSSQALKYDRVYEVPFKIGVFTNISEDHISPIEHPDFEDYFNSKLKLFENSEIAVVNLDMDFVDVALEKAKTCKKVITYSIKNKNADFYARDIKKINNDTYEFYVNDTRYVLGMSGLFNISNALASIAVATILNTSEEKIVNALSKVKVDGRMETYYSKNKKTIAIVDYAHNKLSFSSLLETVKKEYPDKKIIVVFGCPGNKAMTRRKDMGLIANEYADYTYLTKDDPGTEKVEDICREIASFITNKQYEIILDREQAIKKAIQSNSNCVIVIAGKGAEIHQKAKTLEDYKGDAVIAKAALSEELISV